MNTRITTTGELVALNAEKYPDVPFLNFYDEITTYRDLDRKTDAFAAYLQQNGIEKGDIVSFMMGNTPGLFDTLLGTQKIGAIGGPISCWWQAPEVEYLVSDCRPKVLVVDPEFAPVVSAIKEKIPSVEKIIINSPMPMDLDFPHEYLPEIIAGNYAAPTPADPPTADDVAALMYTSGTTGRPKGVMLTHNCIIAGSRVKTMHIPVQPGERSLCVLPLFHSGGLNDLAFPSLFGGATIVLRRNFSASEFWNCVEQYQVNAFYIVPTMWNILLKAQEASQVDTRSLRFGISGAAPIPPEQLAECESRFSVPILEGYGLTETAGAITVNPLDNRKCGSIGKVLPGIEVKIAGENDEPLGPGAIGEIAAKGDTVMKGYFNKPEATAETVKDGWLHTGDVGYMDEEGFLFIVDRKKDLIIRGGVNVYPKEIENVISTHPSVDAVSVIPAPHEIYGQVATACVVLKRGETVDAAELRAFCGERMADYKVPAHVVIRASLPKNAVGKVLKKDLIQEIEDEQTAEAVPVAHFFEGMKARFIPENARGVMATVSYHITGKGGGQWTVTIADGTMTLTAEVLKSPRIYIVARDSAYHDIVTGKLDGITAVLTGKMSIEGDVNFMGEFRQMFKPLEADSD